jgi:hypothetical protein
VVFVIQFSQHEPFDTIVIYISKFFASGFHSGEETYGVGYTCGLESSVLEEYTACVFRRLSLR